MKARLTFIVAALLGVLLVGAALDYGTASPLLCESCHELDPRVETWKASAHATVPCVKCHLEPRPVYAVPLRVADRLWLLGRDITVHVSGDFRDPVEQRITAPPIADEICLQCHDPNRKATSGYRIRIDHAEHAKRNGTCVTCHVRTAHPIESRGKALSLMAQCFTCHGTPEKPKASAECGACHPEGFKLKPVSHEVAKWKRGHGSIAEKDLKQCTMCHEKKWCDSCHGLAMPHPKAWAQGRTGHAVVVAKVGRPACVSCHDEKPDFCSMCHHKDYDPSKGTWQKQHYVAVERDGVSFCLDCHSPVYCARCHTRTAMNTQ